jgi:uncharacterized repeat protein (TIGR01451 family)
VPSILPLHESEHPEELVTLNFRGLGTGYRPVLLTFATLLLLGVLILAAGGPVSKLPVSSSNQFALSSLIPSNSAPKSLDLSHLPMRFEPNQGQTDQQVKFLARGAGYGVFLTRGQAVLTLGALASGSRSNAIRLQLVGANSGSAVSGDDLLPGKSNYFIGNNPAKWHRNVPQFARVRYQAVYPGVDLVYYGNQGQLEYDFEVAPGADPNAIAFQFESSQRPWLDDNGDLILAANSGEVRLKAPRIYQGKGAEQKPIRGKFNLRHDGRVGFEVAAYDRTRVLVIDPVLSYSTYLGGSGDEACSVIMGVATPPSGCPAVAVDPSSNIYLAGSTTSTNFPLTPQPATDPPPAAFQALLAAPPDVFVTKLNSAGNAIVFSTYLGGDGADTTAGVAVDSAFNVVVTGTTTSSNFPVSTSAFQGTRTTANAHAFVSKLDATGSALPYSTYLSGNGSETARGLAVDLRNKIYVIGATTSTDQPDATHSFPATLGAIQVASLGTSQFFVSKIDPALIGFPSLVYSTYFGGGSPLNGLTLAGAIAVDANSNVYITGGTNFQHTGSATTDFPIVNAYQGCLDTPPPATTTTTPNCSTSVTALDAFVAKINPTAASGSQLLYSTYLGGTGDDIGYGIAVDSGLSAYVTGTTGSTDFIIPTGTTAFQGLNGGAAGTLDAFVGKFGNPCTGSTCTTTTVPFTYFSYLGGTGNDAGLSIAVDTLQGARIAGFTNSPNFPVPNNPIQAALSGPVDGFAARIDTTAASSLSLGHYGTYLGGTGSDFATGIAVDSQGSSYVAGETNSTNFPTKNPFQPASGGLTDVFLSKLGPTINLVVTETVTPNPVGVGNNVTFTYTITNSGDLTTGVVFTDVIPAGATLVSANAAGQSCAANLGTVNCTVGTINGGAAATVSVIMTPGQAGALSDGGRVTVFGTNVIVTPNPPPAVATVNDFSIGVSPATVTVAAGIPASYTVTVTPTGNIPEAVTIAASGAPSGGTATFPNGASFTNLSSGPQSRQLVVNTTARVTTPASLFPAGRPFYAALFPIAGLAFLGVGIGGQKSRRRRVLMTIVLGGFFSLVVFQAGCSSSTSTSTTSGTPAGTYNLTVTATSGSATRTQQIVLVVQ